MEDKLLRLKKEIRLMKNEIAVEQGKINKHYEFIMQTQKRIKSAEKRMLKLQRVGA